MPAKKNTKQKVTSKPKKDSLKNSKPTGEGLFPIAAIGASAGGLDAITKLLQNLPLDLGVAYIIIQHLSPDSESILPELLARATKMPVNKVKDGMHINVNEVYVIPPNTYMSVIDGKLALTPRIKTDGTYHTIDFFLNSLAEVYKNKAIAIILSGSATDGTAGVQAVKAEGGITFAQDETARFSGMPKSASESGFVDFVLSPENIGRELASIINHPYTLTAPTEEIFTNEKELRKIRTLLHNKRGIDFSFYKQTTIIRRIMRRMLLHRLDNLEAYTQMLRDNPNEIDLLYKDLLINVTNFFRDPVIYKALTKKIFPALVKAQKPNELIRVWVPACATGEEAYSIAICFFEHLKTKALNPPIQIFATDLNETSIEKARSGIYYKPSLQDISAQRLSRFFIKKDGGYQVIKPIRDVCVFATHNLLKDPPFSRIDLVSCQNVLIYLENNPQKKILQSFNYALKDSGYLLLGKSETIGSASELFTLANKEYKIYTKEPSSTNQHFDFSMRNTIQESVLSSHKLPSMRSAEIDIEKEADKLLLSRYVPASVIINKDMNIVRFHGTIANYLQPSSGKASLHLLKMVRDELLFELRKLIQLAKKANHSVKKEGILLPQNNHFREVTIEVAPIKSLSKDANFLIIFKESADLPEAAPKKNTREVKLSQDTKDRRILVLEQELRETREHIKSMSEEFEDTREELQSSNEEVLSSNEELQSINEEMETSKEELQSTNEELTTINEEVQRRNDELKEAQRELKEREERFRLLVQNAFDIIIIFSKTGTIQYQSEPIQSVLGYKPEETLGKNIFDLDLIHPDDKKNKEAVFKKIIENPNRDIRAEFRLKNKTGNYLIMEGVFINLLDNFHMQGIVANYRDITEKKMLEKQKEQFLGIASHELKTPVTSIKAYTEILEEYFIEANDKQSGELVGKLKKQVDRLNNLIKDLLDITKITEGQMFFNKKEFNINDLINEMAEDFQPLSPKHQIVLELQPVKTIKADEEKIRQVLANLITNAVKYSPDSNKIIITSGQEDKNVKVCIQDFGIGIAEDIQSKVFDRFFRADNATVHAYPGLGLGLYISAEIIKKHNGEISLKSNKDKGSLFCFTLPL